MVATRLIFRGGIEPRRDRHQLVNPPLQVAPIHHPQIGVPDELRGRGDVAGEPHDLTDHHPAEPMHRAEIEVRDAGALLGLPQRIAERSLAVDRELAPFHLALVLGEEHPLALVAELLPPLAADFERMPGGGPDRLLPFAADLVPPRPPGQESRLEIDVVPCQMQGGARAHALIPEKCKHGPRPPPAP